MPVSDCFDNQPLKRLNNARVGPTKPSSFGSFTCRSSIVAEDQFVFPPVDRFVIDMRRNQPALGQEIIERLRIEDRIRVAGVGERIRKQTTDAQLFVRRPADVRDAAAEAILIVRTFVIGVELA